MCGIELLISSKPLVYRGGEVRFQTVDRGRGV